VKMKKFIKKIKKLNACPSSIKWLSSQTTLKQAWENCTRGDWLLWLIAALDVNERKLFLAKGLIAHEIIHSMNDERSIAAVQAAIDYGRSIIDKDELEKAADDALDAVVASIAYSNTIDATYDTITAAAEYAAYAATNAAADATSAAAYATANETYANATASDAALAYATASDAALAYATASTNDSNEELFLQKFASIVKKIFSFEDIEDNLNG